MSASLLRQIFEKELAEKDAELNRLRALLKRSERASYDNDGFCWSCEIIGGGHAPDCELAAAIKEVME